MFKTFRHYYKNANNRSVTIKEWDNLDKALAYAKRYAKGSKFIDCKVTNEENTPLYIVTAEKETAKVEQVVTAEKETAELEQIVAENYIDETPAYHIELVREEKPALTCGKKVVCPKDVADIFIHILKNKDK